MQYSIIILGVAILAAILLIYSALKNAYKIEESDEEEEVFYTQPKFQPRKVTYVITEQEVEKPKRKYKKRKSKNKAIASALSAPVEKRPVGRPRKTTE